MNNCQYGEALIRVGKYLAGFKKEPPEIHVMKGIISVKYETEPDEGYIVYILSTKDAFFIAKYDADQNVRAGLKLKEIPIKEYNGKTKLKAKIKQKPVRKEIKRFMKAITAWFNDEEEDD